MKKGLTPLRKDWRDKSFQRHILFGAPTLTSLPTEYKATGTISDNDQRSSQFCTCYATVAMAELEDGKTYSRSFHAEAESSLLGYNIASQGCDLRTALTVAKRYGFLEKDKEPIDWKAVGAMFAADPSNWTDKASYDAEPNSHSGFTWITGPYDYFDSVRSALYAKQPNGSVSCGTPWFNEWEEHIFAPNSDKILSSPMLAPTTFHNHLITGWKVINGQTVLIDESWQGDSIGEIYFTREVFNMALGWNGAAAATLEKKLDLSQQSDILKKYYTILQWFNELYHKIYG